jgi:ankyrin repeat protein
MRLLRILRASEGSLDVLNELLEHEDCDVDYINIEGATPLHLAVKIKEPELRALIVDSLLDAGADTRSALFSHAACRRPDAHDRKQYQGQGWRISPGLRS